MQPRGHEDTKKKLGFALVASLIMPVVARGFPPRDRGPERAALQQTANAETGKRLFMTYYCYSCHGTEGQGGAGPRLIARATPDSLIRYVRKPTSGNMPAYTSKQISDEDLQDIHAYLRSIPPSPPAKTIVLLQQ
jgi:mono/diheme cytochrome c family protein